MPEAGYLPIPKKLARQGVKDMVRISDARMSGTAFGTIVLHVTPEATVGGPLMNLFAKLTPRAEAGKPIRIGMIGAGKIGSMFLAQQLEMELELIRFRGHP
jgi:hypothetical protein